MSDAAQRAFEKYPFPAWLFAGRDELLARASTAACSPLLRLFLRAHGCKVGKGLRADGVPFVRMQLPGSLSLGRDVAINTRKLSNLAGIAQRTIIQCIGSGRIEIGDGCGLSGCVLSARTSIRLGRGASIGANARLYDHDFHSARPEHRRDRRSDQLHVRSRAIEIGAEVLVGANAIVLKGARIGDGSIVGAGSVVTAGAYPPNSIIAGNPASVVAAVALPS